MIGLLLHRLRVNHLRIALLQHAEAGMNAEIRLVDVVAGLKDHIGAVLLRQLIAAIRCLLVVVDVLLGE